MKDAIAIGVPTVDEGDPPLCGNPHELRHRGHSGTFVNLDRARLAPATRNRVAVRELRKQGKFDLHQTPI